MKFKYDNKTYYVFADREEIDKKGHLIKINEEYFLPDFSVKTDSLGKAYYDLCLSKYTKLSTTQVLSHIANARKILIAYEVNFSYRELARVYHEVPYSLDIEAHIKEFRFIKDKITTVTKDTYTSILWNQEETEEEVKERVTKSIDCRCVSEVDKIKYFIV